MEEKFDALEVIASTRGKVNMDSTPVGENIFLLWGALTAAFFLIQFILWQLLRQDWCLWIWTGAVLVGWPWMIVMLRRDHDRTHRRTHESKIILDVWIFVGGACAIGGLAFGIADLFEVFAIPVIGLLIGVGAFVTGVVNRFRPKIIGGIAGAAIGICSFLLQEDLCDWQMLSLALIAVVSLVIPGWLYKKSISHGV